MDVRWLIPVAPEEEEPIWAAAQNRRAHLSDCRRFRLPAAMDGSWNAGIATRVIRQQIVCGIATPRPSRPVTPRRSAVAPGIRRL
jgi:hypothetical protein